jgi:hypothetical protein
VRLCNNIDDLHSFGAFGALDKIYPPTFCTKPDAHGQNSQASRNHLSLCGVAVADMVSPGIILPVPGPMPSRLPAKMRGCITWAEVQTRAYMFGAIRHKPDQFAKAFLDELRARPDLFIVVTRSDSDPGREVENFGGSPNEVPFQMRSRTFEAPFALPGSVPHGRGEWDIQRSAVDILYGRKPIQGYLIALERPGSAGWFFHFKKFPVKYFVILDATPGRHVHHIVRLVAWAAFRALKLVNGEYNLQSYHKASDAFFQKHASERLSWMTPDYGSWHATKMAND